MARTIESRASSLVLCSRLCSSYKLLATVFFAHVRLNGVACAAFMVHQSTNCPFSILKAFFYSWYMPVVLKMTI